jgi:23S rRNA A2030 N6-methylase RlmJ
MARVSAKDIQLTHKNELMVSDDGDLVIHESDSVHIENILLASKGHFKHSPITGCGLAKMINSPATLEAMQGFLHTLKKQLEYDGYTAIKLQHAGSISTLKIDAQRDE